MRCLQRCSVVKHVHALFDCAVVEHALQLAGDLLLSRVRFVILCVVVVWLLSKTPLFFLCLWATVIKRSQSNASANRIYLVNPPGDIMAQERGVQCPIHFHFRKSFLLFLSTLCVWFVGLLTPRCDGAAVVARLRHDSWKGCRSFCALHARV